MCLMHSHQKDWFRHDQIRYSNINLSNFNVKDIEDAKTRLICMKSVSKLRKLLIFPPNQLKLDILASRTAVGKDQRTGWSIMQMSYLVNDWKY